MQCRVSPSEEQSAVIENIRHGHNVVINATPGSGKTTACVLNIMHLDLRILVLTFSRHLYIEGRNKVEQWGCPEKKQSFYSLDGFAYRYYHQKLCGDIDFNRKPLDFAYDVVIIDEAQDLGFKHYRFIRKLLKDNKVSNPIIGLMGDIKQSIFSQMDSVASDSRFLSLAESIFPSERKWVFLTLSETFRMSVPVCNFVNNVIMNSAYITIRSKKQSIYKPRYLIYDQAEEIANEINFYIDQGYQPSDIIVVSPTVDKSNTIKEIVNILLSKYNIYVQSNDDNLRYDAIYGANKIKFFTYHAAKGLESKVVIVLGFDSSLFRYQRMTNPKECPNTLYVASTRASERMTVCHASCEDYLPFIDIEKLDSHVERVNDKPCSSHPFLPGEMTQSVTNLTKYVSEVHLKEVVSMFTIKQLKFNEGDISLPENVTNNTDGIDITENVSDINGVAITALYEYFSTGNMEIYRTCNNELKEEHKKYFSDSEMLKYFNGKSPFTDQSNILKQLLVIATCYDALSKGTFHRLKQIKNYEWLSHDVILRLIDRLKKIKFKSTGFETKLNKDIKFGEFNTMLYGRADYIDESKIIEIKCKTSLSYEDYIQLMIYKFMSNSDRSCFLYNIRNGELFKVSASNSTIHDAIIRILEYKNCTQTDTDDEFINKCLSITI